MRSKLNGLPECLAALVVAIVFVTMFIGGLALLFYAMNVTLESLINNQV